MVTVAPGVPERQLVTLAEGALSVTRKTEMVHFGIVRLDGESGTNNKHASYPGPLHRSNLTTVLS